ncbi:MAG: FAD-binding oxidoreductase [Pseudomonadota bacterium]
MATEQRGKLSFWTWGHEIDEPTEGQRSEAAKNLSKSHGVELKPPPIPKVADITLRLPRVQLPSNLQDFCTTDKHDRITHTYGGHSFEMLRALRGDFENPPDAVAYPETDEQLERILAWCDQTGAAAVPYGGGTTVVWGVTPPEDRDAVVTIDMARFDKILEIDDTSRAARIQAGILGPDLEAALKPKGYTLRHFPQSFPWSTLGGWIATRSGGHYATNHTHIDDFVESTRMLTPAGWWESRRLPGSGAGPSPDRMVLGSEGTLGIITEAWMRIQKRPTFRATAGVTFSSWQTAYEAVRHIAQAKLWPANLRLLDPVEAGTSAGLDGKTAFLIIGFESSEVPQGAFIQEAVKIAREFGGTIDDEDILIADASGQVTGREGAVGAWRNAFIGVNAGMTNGLGLVNDTFETAVTWDQWPEFDAHVREKVGQALKEVLGDTATLSCRFTHVYTDGPAPYYTFGGLGKLGGEFEQWQAIKQAASDALIAAGGTITHHHAVGRMHKDHLANQHPPLFGDALRAAKQAVDPNSILNPGVLFDLKK